MSDAEKAIDETTKRAREWLLEADGTTRGIEWYVKWLTLGSVFRLASAKEQVNPRPDADFVSFSSMQQLASRTMSLGTTPQTR